MKCSKCGYEFGEGVTCQHCGIDRVTGLGNYSGYSPNKGSYSPRVSSNNNTSVSYSYNPVKSSTMICYKCGEIIPADSKFCPHCSTSLYVTCPYCGHEYSSQYPACNKCGTNREEYYAQKFEKEKRVQEYKNKQREKERKRQEEEKKRREEWEKSPEGQAELERKRKEKEEARKLKQRANEIRVDLQNQCSADKSIKCVGGIMAIVISPIILYSLIGRGAGSGIESLIVVLLCLVAFVMFFGGIFYLILGIALDIEDYISKYKKNHPDDPVSNYL